MKKRILSILLCCVMLAGMLPSVAFAEGGTGSLTVTIDGFQVDNTPNDCTYTFSSTIPGVTFSADDIQYISWEKYAADDDLYSMNNTDVFRVDTRYRCVIQLDNNGLTEVPAVTVNGNTPDYCTLPYFGGVAQALSIGCDIGTPQVNPALVEQFPGLTPGETYWFDLSGADIPGNKNGSLPDDSLHWVPFTYVGTVSAYVLKSRSANDNTARYDAANAAGSTDPSNPIGYTYDHSLFIADYNVTSRSDWNNLNGKNLIFGTAYTSGGVYYTLRAPSAGSNGTASGGTPASNEWDAILDKANQSYQDNTVGYIKNWNGMYSWGQDTQDGPDPDWNRATRGSFTARSWQFDLQLSPSVGFRPVLELPSSDTLGSDGLATVTLDLNGGSIGSITGTINFAVKSDFNLTLPSGTDVTRPDGNDGTYFMWQDSSGNLYEPGAQVSANVGRLTALWKDSINPVITGLENDKTYCDTVEFEVSDNDGIASVTAGNEVLTAGSSGKYTLAAGVGTVTVVVTDKADNETSVTVTVNNGHTASNDDGDCSTPVYCIYHPNTVVVEAKSHDFSGEWNKDENGHWHTCQNDGCTVAEPKTPHSGTDDGDCTTAVICECGYTITAANAEHTYEWQSENGQYWKKCQYCGDETAKKDIPTMTINGADAVCITKDYKFSFTLPEGATDAVYGYEFENKGDLGFLAIIENNEPHGVVSLEWYEPSENSFKVYAGAKTADGFEFCVSKTVALKSEHTDAAPKDHLCDVCGATLSEHTGGEATCTDKAVCEYCGNEYGELSLNNHTDLKHFPAKAATKTAEGNIEYWYCSGCGKYYKDAAATKEIAKADTVIAKLLDDTKSPQTGDNSHMALWMALLFVSGAGVIGTTVYAKKKKHSEN